MPEKFHVGLANCIMLSLGTKGCWFDVSIAIKVFDARSWVNGAVILLQNPYINCCGYHFLR